MREYELMFLLDPRLADEETVELSNQYSAMIEAGGGEVYKQESWGKRKLAYQINKLSEGRYMLFHVRSETGDAFNEVEQRMRQNERVLRYMTVRTDSGRLRYRTAGDENEADEATAGEPEAGSSEEE